MPLMMGGSPERRRRLANVRRCHTVVVPTHSGETRAGTRAYVSASSATIEPVELKIPSSLHARRSAVERLGRTTFSR